MIKDEDNISLEEVISICNTIKCTSIEIKDNNILNTKTQEFMVKYDLDERRIRFEVKKLKKEDYHSGPLEDKNTRNKHPLWVFLKYIEGVPVKIYIKIKIINHKRKIIVYSFHEEGLHNEAK